MVSGCRAGCAGSAAWLGPVLCGALIVAGCAEGPGANGRRAGWLGLDTHIGFPTSGHNSLPGHSSPAGRELSYRLIAELGVPKVRVLVMNWAVVQPHPGGFYDFALSDDLVKRGQEIGVETLAVCGGIPQWAAARPEDGAVDSLIPSRENEAAFTAFVRRFVERYDGDGVGDMPGLRVPLHTYEFISEPERIAPMEYAFWLSRFYETVRAADSKSTVVLGSLRSPGIKMADQPGGDYETYLERLLACAELKGPRFPCFDVAAFSNFPADYPGRTEFDDALAYVRRTLAERSLKLPIWLTGFGYNSGSAGDANREQRQAEYVVKWALRAHALGFDRVYAHSLWNDHRAGDTGPRDNVGLMRDAPGGQSPQRKPAFMALSLLVREIQRRPQVTFRGPSVYVLAGSGKPVYCVWQERGAESPATGLSDWWEVRTLDGRKNTVQGAAMSFDPTPRFIEQTESPFMQGISSPR